MRGSEGCACQSACVEEPSESPHLRQHPRGAAVPTTRHWFKLHTALATKLEPGQPSGWPFSHHKQDVPAGLLPVLLPVDPDAKTAVGASSSDLTDSKTGPQQDLCDKPYTILPETIVVSTSL